MMQAAAREPDARIIRMDGQIRDQHLRDLQRLEARMHGSALRARRIGYHMRYRAARPAAVGIRERLQQARELVQALVGRVDEHQAAPLRRRQQGAKRGVAVADLDPDAAGGADVALGRSGLRRHELDEDRAILRRAALAAMRAGDPGIARQTAARGGRAPPRSRQPASGSPSRVSMSR